MQERKNTRLRKVASFRRGSCVQVNFCCVEDPKNFETPAGSSCAIGASRLALPYYPQMPMRPLCSESASTQSFPISATLLWGFKTRKNSARNGFDFNQWKVFGRGANHGWRARLSLLEV